MVDNMHVWISPLPSTNFKMSLPSEFLLQKVQILVVYQVHGQLRVFRSMSTKQIYSKLSIFLGGGVGPCFCHSF